MIALKRFIKNNISFIVILTYFLIFSILLPLLFLFNSSNIEKELFERITFLTLISITSGCIATILTIIKDFYLYPFSRISLYIKLGIQTQIFLYILIWVQFWKFKIELEYFYFLVDFSGVFIYLCVIPILFMVRILYSYIISYKRVKNNVILLSIIKNGNFTTKNQIRKYINQMGLSLTSTNATLLKSIEFLESDRNLLIVKKNKYQLTKKGKEILSWFEKNRSATFERIVLTPKKISSKMEIPLQVWTEEDLEKYNKKR